MNRKISVGSMNDEIIFYFGLPKNNQWFYSIYPIKKSTGEKYACDSLDDWVRHCREKNWWTPEIEKKVVKYGLQIINKKNGQKKNVR